MTESVAAIRPIDHRYARPVLFVSDVHGALRFYVDQLGFTKKSA